MEKYSLYNNNVQLFFDPGKHLYFVSIEGGEMKPVIGVTTATGALDKPALVPWAVNLTLDYVRAHFHFSPKKHKIEIDEMIENARHQWRRRKTDAASIGTKVHVWAESYIKGENPPIPKAIAIKTLVTKFLNWVENYKVKFLESEKKIYSLQYDYAGTIDFEAEINGELCIGDFKTSNGIWDDYRFQIAAYNQARAEETGNNYKASWIIRFPKDPPSTPKAYLEPDFEVLYIPKEEHEKDFQGFLGAMVAKRRLMELERERKIKKLRRGFS